MVRLSGVSLTAAGGPAVSTSSRATWWPSRLATATSLPGAKGTSHGRWRLPALPLGVAWAPRVGPRGAGLVVAGRLGRLEVGPAVGRRLVVEAPHAERMAVEEQLDGVDV